MNAELPPIVHQMWNEAATKVAILQHKEFSLWPLGSTLQRSRPLLVTNGPTPYVNLGGHTL